jgi:putative ABC transport system permease protein
MIVPDEVAGNLPVRFKMLYFYCNGDSEAMQAKLSERIKALQGSAGGKAVTKVSSDVALQNTEAFPIMAVTKSETRASYVASKAMIAYVGIYLGIIFLITSAAILALQQLSEMADNRRRYAVLKKIGADDKMTGRAILKQTAIYFLLPLALACVHSVVGLSVINSALASVGSVDAFSSSFITAAIIVVVYGAYFLATYWGSRNLIQKSELTV